jgi:RNA polymerase sigma-70 factor (ECF subfamily)
MTSFEALCQANYGRIYKYIYAMTGRHDASEDLTQEVFTVAFQKGDGFLLHEKPAAFLYKTARNLTLTYLKRQQIAPLELLDESIPSGEGDLYDQLEQKQSRLVDEDAWAGQVIAALSSDKRALYEKRYIAKQPIDDIAREYGISGPAARMRLMRLRQEIDGAVKKLRLDDF